MATIKDVKEIAPEEIGDGHIKRPKAQRGEVTATSGNEVMRATNRVLQKETL